MTFVDSAEKPDSANRTEAIRWALEQRGLSDRLVRTLTYYASWFPQMRMPMEWVAAGTGKINERSARRDSEELVKLGYLERKKQGHGYVYTLLFQPEAIKWQRAFYKMKTWKAGEYHNLQGYPTMGKRRRADSHKPDSIESASDPCKPDKIAAHKPDSIESASGRHKPDNIESGLNRTH